MTQHTAGEKFQPLQSTRLTLMGLLGSRTSQLLGGKTHYFTLDRGMLLPGIEVFFTLFVHGKTHTQHVRWVIAQNRTAQADYQGGSNTSKSTG